MNAWDVVLVAWLVGLATFVAGAAWGRVIGRGAALADAAVLLEEEAVRWTLQGEDLAAASFWRLSGAVRRLADPPELNAILGPAPAGTTASKADGARLDTSGAR